MFIKLLVLTAVTGAVIATDDCECNSESDRKAVWSYLKSLSKEIDGTRDKTAYSVLPAVLSPLIGCDCKEKIRPKRKIMPNVEESKPKHIRHEKKTLKMKSIKHNDRNCPTHYARVGAYCVKEELLD